MVTLDRASDPELSNSDGLQTGIVQVPEESHGGSLFYFCFGV